MINLIRISRIAGLTIGLFYLAIDPLWAQVAPDSTLTPQQTRDKLDSLYIDEIQQGNEEGPAKVLHAEPLFIDLIRDLGARKGEKEWNVGMELRDRQDIRDYHGLVEYEWAPLNRLGMEIELPFSFATTHNEAFKDSLPAAHLESVKGAIQYSFFVSERMKTSLALGYIHELMLYDFREISSRNTFSGHVFNPFLVAAKRWGQNFHTLVYTGPEVEWVFNDQTYTTWQLNTSVHYMLDGTRNFIGVEINKDFSKEYGRTMLRPQMRVALAENMMVGIVTGIPLGPSRDGISAFVRLIYEPGHKALSRRAAHCD